MTRKIKYSSCMSNEECKFKNLSLLVKNNLNSAYINNKLKKGKKATTKWELNPPL